MDSDFRRYLCAFLAEGAGIDLGDDLLHLVNGWYRHPEPFMGREIEKMIGRAEREPWAWVALQRLYTKMRAAGEPLPVSLQRWADDVVMGRRCEPVKRGPKPDTARAARYLAAVEGLIGLGIVPTREKAIYVLAEASGENEDAIRKILDRAR